MNKKFIIYILSTVVISIGIATGFVMFINSNLRSDHVVSSVFQKLNQITSKNTKYDILFLGSSRTLEYVNPKIIDKINNSNSLNGGMYGANILYSEMLLRAYLGSHPKPRLVVYDIDAQSLDTDMNLDQYIPFYLPYLGNKIVSSSLLPELKQVQRIKLFPFLAAAYYTDEIIGIGFLFTPVQVMKKSMGLGVNNNASIVAMLRGYWGKKEGWRPNSDEELKKRFEKKQTIIGLNLLASLITTCKRNNIPLVMTFNPVYLEYSNMITNFDEWLGNMVEIAKNQGIKFWRYDGLDICQSKKYFYKYDHLNEEGAKIFSEVIAKDIRRLNLL